jgi:outer membrane immunogenic protein
MRNRILMAGFLVAALATSAMAKDGPYVGASGGVTLVHDSDLTVTGVGTATGSFDTGGAFNVEAGYRIQDARFAFQFGYKNADLSTISGPGGSVGVTDTQITVLSYMANGYYDFKNTSAVTPFLGAGIGLLSGKFESQGTSDTVNEFGYQFTAGLGFKASDNVMVDLSYLFQGAANDFSKDGTSVSYHSSNFLAGVRYNF